MKNLLLLSIIVLSGSLMSCKKDYTCDCKLASGDQKITIDNAKKDDAKKTCDTAESTYKMADATANCDLK